MASDIMQEIRKTIEHNDVVVYMKGTAKLPQCGFSALVVNVLAKLGVEFADINILQDAELRQAIKEFSDWPTIPQLYIKGEFIGGADIVKEMYESGELVAVLQKHHLLPQAIG